MNDRLYWSVPELGLCQDSSFDIYELTSSGYELIHSSVRFCFHYYSELFFENEMRIPLSINIDEAERYRHNTKPVKKYLLTKAGEKPI